MAHHLRRVGLSISTALVVTPILTGLTAHAATAAPTVSSVIAAAKSALAKQTGVHLELASTSGSTKDDVKADFGTKMGAEVIVTGKATATVKVTPTYGYISGNVLGLTSVVGLSSAEAKKVGTRWISIKAGTSQYSAVATGTTISSLTSVLPVTKGTTLTTTTEHGLSVHVLKWTTAATGTTPKLAITLTISATGTILPVEAVSTAADGTKATTKLSHWGGQPLVSAPPIASTIASSKVTG